MQTISVVIRDYGVEDLLEYLKALFENTDCELLVPDSNHNTAGFSLEPATFIVSGAAVLSTLINGLIAYLRTQKTSTISIKGKGWEVKVPQDSSRDKIREIVALARERDAKEIQVSLKEED